MKTHSTPRLAPIVLLLLVLLTALAAPVLAARLSSPKSQEGALCISQQSGNWSDPTTWDCGHVPGDGDGVIIARDHVVMIDTDTAVLSNVTIAGALHFDNTGAGRTMHVKGNTVIDATGVFDIIPDGMPTEHTLLVDETLAVYGKFMPKTVAGSDISVLATQIFGGDVHRAPPPETSAISADEAAAARPSAPADSPMEAISTEPSAVMAAGDGVPIVYYDFESDSNRGTFENAVDQQINSSNSTLTRTGGSGTLYSGIGAGQQFSRGGPATGRAVESAYWPTTTTDPGISATYYVQVSLNTAGFTGISLAYDLFTGTTAAYYPCVGTLVSYNAGADWSPLQAGSCPGNNTWSQRTVALSASADNNANLRIRFYGYYSSNTSTDYLRLDNVVLYATSTTTSAGTKQLLDEPDIYTGTTSGNTGSVYIRTGTITFTGAGTTVVFGSDWAANGAVVVSNGATLNTGGAAGVRVLVSGSSATFTADSGTTLEINSSNGITSSGASGNIQTEGTRTFNTGASYVYNGTAAQVTGNGLPATVNNLTVNNAAGVTLSQAAAVNGNLTISAGTLDVSTSNYGLTVAGNWINNGGFNARSGTVTFNGTTTMSGSSTTSLNNVVINSTKSLTAPSGNLNVAGNWTNSGTFTPGTGTVTFSGANQNVNSYGTPTQTNLLSEGFASITPPAFPTGWSVVDSNGAPTWGTSNSTNAPNFPASGNHARYSFSFSKAADDWFFTSSLSLTAGQTYYLQFNYGARSASFPESLNVWVGNAQTVAGMSAKLVEYASIINTSWATSGPTAFTVASSGTYYVGFHAYSASNMWELAVDDVLVYTFVANPTASTFNHLTVNSGSTTTPGGNLTLNGNLLVNAGGTLDVGANAITGVEGTVTNNGTLKQTRTVNNATVAFLNIKNIAATTDKYFGVQMATTNNLGSTTVYVSGNRPLTSTCPDIASGSRPVRRCYLIDVTTAASASATFYYTYAELRADLGQSAANLKVWRNTSGTTWTQLASTPNTTCGTGQLNCSVQATSFTPTRIDGAASPADTTDDYVLMGSNPQAVTLADFSAAQQGDAVLLTWETNSELENRGFNLYRGTSDAGPDRQLNETLIPSQSQGNPGGFIYTWEDRADLVSGTTYFYWVEDVDIYGTATRHGPVSVDYGAPTAVRVLDMGAGASLPLALPLIGAGLLALAGLAARRRRG